MTERISAYISRTRFYPDKGLNEIVSNNINYHYRGAHGE